MGDREGGRSRRQNSPLPAPQRRWHVRLMCATTISPSSSLLSASRDTRTEFYVGGVETADLSDRSRTTASSNDIQSIPSNHASVSSPAVELGIANDHAIFDQWGVHPRLVLVVLLSRTEEERLLQLQQRARRLSPSFVGCEVSDSASCEIVWVAERSQSA